MKVQKTTIQICSEYGIHVTQITHWKQQVLAGLPTLFGEKTLRMDEREKEELTVRLYQQIGQLKVEVDFLKKAQTDLIGMQPKRILIDKGYPEVRISKQCKLLSLARSTFY